MAHSRQRVRTWQPRQIRFAAHASARLSGEFPTGKNNSGLLH